MSDLSEMRVGPVPPNRQAGYQVVFTDVTAEWFEGLLSRFPHLQMFPIPYGSDDLPCYGIGPTPEAWDRFKGDDA